MNGCGRGNNGFNEGEAIRFALGHGRNGAALALAGDDDDAALAGLVLGKAAVDPVFLAVGRLEPSTSTVPESVAPWISEAMASRSL